MRYMTVILKWVPFKLCPKGFFPKIDVPWLQIVQWFAVCAQTRKIVFQVFISRALIRAHRRERQLKIKRLHRTRTEWQVTFTQPIRFHYVATLEWRPQVNLTTLSQSHSCKLSWPSYVFGLLQLWTSYQHRPCPLLSQSPHPSLSTVHLSFQLLGSDSQIMRKPNLFRFIVPLRRLRRAEFLIHLLGNSS